MKLIIACRHGEAFKNLKNIYGGGGSGLTENGQKQASELAKKLKYLVDTFGCKPTIYRSCDRVQIIETAEVIKNALNVAEVQKHEKFRPIELGVFNGMSREKQLQLYPDACEAHAKWEKGLIDITESEKLVEGMQPAAEYFDQVSDFIKSLPKDQIHILVGTRSDLSCLKNVIKGQSPRDYMQYKYYNSDYCEMVIGLVQDNGKIKPLSYEEILEIIRNKMQEENSALQKSSSGKGSGKKGDGQPGDN